MQAIRRITYEFRNLLSVLGPREKLAVILNSIRHAASILMSRKLLALDRSMSRNIDIHFHGRPVRVPVRTIDDMLSAGVDDSFTFGTVREMFGNDVYLRAFKPGMQCPCVLDLGCNRGLFSLIAAKVLGARTVLGVEPSSKYESVHMLLASQNSTLRPTVYWKMAGSTASEKASSDYVSIATIIAENHLSIIDFAKIDVEGAESDIFTEPGWLAITQNLAMELHPDYVDTAPVLEAVRASGFQVEFTDQFGTACDFKNAMFLYGSRTGSLKSQTAAGPSVAVVQQSLPRTNVEESTLSKETQS